MQGHGKAGRNQNNRSHVQEPYSAIIATTFLSVTTSITAFSLVWSPTAELPGWTGRSFSFCLSHSSGGRQGARPHLQRELRLASIHKTLSQNNNHPKPKLEESLKSFAMYLSLEKCTFTPWRNTLTLQQNFPLALPHLWILSSDSKSLETLSRRVTQFSLCLRSQPLPLATSWRYFSDIIIGPHQLISSKGVIWIIWKHSTELSLRTRNPVCGGQLLPRFRVQVYQCSLPLTCSWWLWFLGCLANLHKDTGHEMNLSASPPTLSIHLKASSANEPQASTWFCLRSGIKNAHHHAWLFLHGFWGSHQGPHTCLASTSLSYLSTL